MDETEKQGVLLDQVPQGEAFEEWKSKFKGMCYGSAKKIYVKPGTKV